MAVSWILALCVFGWIGMLVAAATAWQHKVDGAADLVAVSAATGLQRGDDACRVASSIAADNDVRLGGCRVEGEDVIVEVLRRVRLGFGISRQLVGDARAGPTHG
jgi:secretion/DNA translocation related TadE-like protein